MSDAVPATSADSRETAAPSAGALLRQAREAAGLHVAALAVSMKVPVKKLEALEADRLDLLPDAVFVRALASSVCRTLKIDPLPILALLPQTATPRLGAQERSINAPFHASGETRSNNLPEFLRKPVFLAVAALLVAALGVVFFPDPQVPPTQADLASEPLMPPDTLQAPTDSSGNAPALAGVLPTAPEPTAAGAPATAPAASPSVAATPLLQTAPPPALAPASAQATPAASAPAAYAPAAVVAPAPAAAGDAQRTGLLVLRSKGEAWVEVVDATGVVQVRKTLSAGQSTSASGPLPLSVVVGRADATEVEVRGKALSLEKIAKDNVARFEVK